MRVPSWLSSLVALLAPTRCRRAHRRLTFRPCVEGLEDRTTPSAVPLTDLSLDVSPASGVTAVGSWVYFVTDPGTDQAQLWRTDGQPGHAAPVDTGGKPVLASLETNSPRNVVVAAGPWLYFVTNDGAGDYSLWRNDSRNGQSQELRTFGSAPSPWSPDVSPGPYGLTAFGQDVYYVAYEPDTGYELHRTAGDETGTTTVFDLLPGPESSWPNKPWATDTYVYASVREGPFALYGIDATASDSVAHLVPSPTEGVPYLPFTSPGGTDYFFGGAIPTAVGSDLYFANIPFGGGLWRLTSPNEAPQFIPTVEPTEIGGIVIDGIPFLMTAANGTLYFTGGGGGAFGSSSSYSLWKVEGATATLLQNFPDAYLPDQMVAVGSDLYISDYSQFAFAGYRVTFPTRLWKCSTTGSGSPELIATPQERGGMTDPGIASLTPVGSSLYFQLTDADVQSLGIGLEGWWQPAATATGAQQVTPPGLVVAEDHLYVVSPEATAGGAGEGRHGVSVFLLGV
jgi:ELWxxDGT repeat protein